MKRILILLLSSPLSILCAQDKPISTDYNHAYSNSLTKEGNLRKGITPGYYLGFRNISDKLRVFSRPPTLGEQSGLLHSFYFDFHYATQEFNAGFYNPEGRVLYDTNRSNNLADPSLHSPGNIAHDLYGITLGFALGNNPNLDIKIPLAVSRFEVDHLDDTGFLGGIELFPNYRINDYIAWGVNLAYINSVSDFPIFDESITSVSLEALAESNPVYGINWSGRFSMGNYFPSNGDSFWLYKADLALHFQISENFVFVPFFGINLATDDLAVNGTTWLDFGSEFAFYPLSPWGFNLGLSGIAGHDVIDTGLEFYGSTSYEF
jgi:hypothetical protein